MGPWRDLDETLPKPPPLPLLCGCAPLALEETGSEHHLRGCVILRASDTHGTGGGQTNGHKPRLFVQASVLGGRGVVPRDSSVYICEPMIDEPHRSSHFQGG